MKVFTLKTQSTIRTLLAALALAICPVGVPLAFAAASPAAASPVAALSAQRVEELGGRLTRAIESRLEEKLYDKFAVGIRIMALNGQSVLYERDAETLYIPASAAKIFSAVSLIRFGPDHRFETPVMTDGEVRAGVLEGGLYLVGRGDPSLEPSHLEAAARRLYADGLRAVRGDLVYDVSHLEVRGPLHPPNARHLYAPSSALTVGSNWIVLGLEDGPPPRLWPIPDTAYVKLDHDIRIEASDRPGRPEMTYREMPWGDAYTIRGAVTRWDKRFKYLRLGVSRPGLYAATLLEEACEKAGIKIEGEIRGAGVPPASSMAVTTLATIRTAPLVDAIRALNQESNNVVAELVTQNLGAAFHSVPGTRAKGLEVIRRYLVREVGLEEGAFRLADASGLSIENRFSATQLTRALNHFHRASGGTFAQTLAPQGHHPHAMAVVPPADMRIFVKSGTLPATGVNTLVGYVFLERTGEALSFAFLTRRRGAGPSVYSGTMTNPLLRSMVEALSSRK